MHPPELAKRGNSDLHLCVLLCSHLLAPHVVAVDGHDGVDGIEDAAAIDAFVDVEAGTDGIDHEPHPPLFDVLAREHPHGDDGERGGEGVDVGHSAVGTLAEEDCDGYEENDEHQGEPQPQLAWGATDGNFGAPFGLAAEPDDEAVDACKEVIDFHAAVGIDAGLIEHDDVDGGHDATYHPHPWGGAEF